MSVSQLQGIQRHLQAQHGHARIAQQTQVGEVGVLLDERAHLSEAQAAGFGDTAGLEGDVLRADVRVEPDAGGATSAFRCSTSR